jgi:hypothetical protein
MSTATIYGTPPVQNPFSAPTDPAIVEELHAQLKPEGVEAYIRYVMNRTPADMQDEMLVLLQGDISGAGGGPVDDTQTLVSNGDSVIMANGTWALGLGTVEVVGGALTKARIDVPTMSFVMNDAAIPLHDPAGVVQPNSPAIAVVADYALTHATYTAPVVVP